MDNQLYPDLISELPASIIERILILVPIRDAIRTSILSSKWRYRWTRLPQLDFHEERMFSLERRDVNHVEYLENFVNCTLFLHQGPIHKFKLFVKRMHSCPVTDQWLLFLSRTNMEELILCSAGGGDAYFHVPSCLYSCRKLTLLDLYGCQFGPTPPTFEGFLYLRTLILQLVKAPIDAIESIVSSSPLLENLHCEDAEGSGFRASAPNLKYINLGGSFHEIHLCAPLLAKMKIRWDNDVVGAKQLQHERVCNYTNFLGGFTNLESLIGISFFTKYLSIGIEYCQHPLVFHHLEFISLWVDFHLMDEIMVLVRLIVDASTSLHELYVTLFCSKEDASEAAQMIHLWDSEWLSNCTFKKLKVINIVDFLGSLHEMKFIKFLLESSPVLETMTVEADESLTDLQETMNSIVELFRYPRASSNANILFRRS